jgi:type III pantothenate kinase
MLLVDLGNTRLRWATHSGGVLGESCSLAHHRTFDAALFERAWGGMSAPQRLIIANVVGSCAGEALRAWAHEHWQVAPEVAGARRAACGVSNAYAEPARLGIDRWAALVAAHNRYNGPLAVVDCGTAITVDAVTSDGRHLGGLIAPGCALMGRALDAGTQGVGRTEPGGCAALSLGADTLTGAACGVLHGAVGFIEHAVATAERSLNAVPRVVLTGGDAVRLRPFLRASCVHEPDLVLAGLALLAEAHSCGDTE